MSGKSQLLVSDGPVGGELETIFNIIFTAVVTGGGSGIGMMIASALVQNGAKVYIASRKESQLKEVTDALNKKGPGSCSYVVADLSSKAGCDRLANAIKSKEQKIHILVNNSGATWGAPYDNNTGVFTYHFFALYFDYMKYRLTDVLAKDSNNQDPARVINISSVAAFTTLVEGKKMSSGGSGTWSCKFVTCKHPEHFVNLYATDAASKAAAYAFKTQGEEGMAVGQPMGKESQ
ncbi:hypothetical protein Clacol_006118 [Clathrus columnatus]|uniref:NAD(P)-binding protein n=1 Tax=Clathrus columnatus TaxID=1419009 RepID=A0AAV5AC04_9AGAM|nr:hypothetical protein Clacol_006118 [Clathrus columnatus]